MADCIRAGSLASVREKVAKDGPIPRMVADPRRTAALFHGCFAESPAESHDAFAHAVDLSDARVVADLGGGGGGLLVSLLTANPHLRGLLFDLEGAMQGARERIGAAGLAGRCELRVGDLLEGVPPEADVYTMKHVLHIFEDDRARRLLENCRAVAGPGDRLLVLEHVLPERVTRADPALEDVLMDDLNMLAVTGGGERTEGQWRGLLGSAGFAVRRVIEVPGTEIRIVDAQPAD